MKTKTIKALAKINILLDEEQQKLSDKLKNLKLSHNRKYKLLQNIERNLKILCYSKQLSNFDLEVIKDLLSKINNELTFCGRVKGIF